MSDAQASFAINLEDGTSGAADAAAGALQRLRAQIEGDQRALRAMQGAMRGLQGGTVVNIEAFRQLQSQIESKKQAIASAQSSYVSLGGTFSRTSSGSRSLADRFRVLENATKGLPGPLGMFGARLAAVKGVLAGGAIAIGVAAAAAAFVLLTVAAIAAGVALARYALASADARRSEALRFEGLALLEGAQGSAASAAGQLQSSIDSVAASSALGRDKVAGYAEQLYRMGLRGENLKAALEGVAIKAAVQGDAQAKAFAAAAAGADRTGRSVRALADEVKGSLGGVAAAQMLELSVQSAKLRESWAALFGGLKLEGFLNALRSITDLFSQNTATGRALKALLTAAFQPLIDGASEAAPIVKRFFQGIVIGALEIGIAVLKVRNWFRDTFGGSDLLKGMDATNIALTAGKIAVGLLAAGLVVVAAAIGGVVVSLALLSAPFVLATAAAMKLYDVGLKLGAWLESTDFATLGVAIVDGIVDGLMRGGAAVHKAVQALGAGAIKAFRAALGIASPSKAFTELGAALPRGIEVGVHREGPAARRAVATMVRAPRDELVALRDAAAAVPALPELTPTRAEAPQGAGAARTAPRVEVHVGEIHVHTQSERPRDHALEVRDELVRLLEGVAIELGLPVTVPS